MVKRAVLWSAAVLAAGCGISSTPAPPLAGPSEFAVSITVSAAPTQLNWDGGSQSAITVRAHDATGGPLAGLSLRVDMEVGGVLQDFGTLAARTLVTGRDGTASTVYTAPPGPPAGTGGPGTDVTIVATPQLDPSGTFDQNRRVRTSIHLTPTGILLPIAPSPTARFTFAPSSPTANTPVQFDASTSCAGPPADATTCAPVSNSISSYVWSFGDGSTATGALVSHAFTNQQTYSVTLTVTNDRGVSASTTQPIALGAGTPPTAEFSSSPATPTVGLIIAFNAAPSKAGPGHRLVQFVWDFGDPGNPAGASGSSATHAYTVVGTYTVTLVVTDDAGQQGIVQHPVTVH